eukprot:3152239-Rhodomonas_salina.1
MAFRLHVRSEVCSGPPADYLDESEAVRKDCEGPIGVSSYNSLCDRGHLPADNHGFPLHLEGEVELALGTVRPCTDKECFPPRFCGEQLPAAVSPDFLLPETLMYVRGELFPVRIVRGAGIQG